jgi:hypothetical protein
MLSSVTDKIMLTGILVLVAYTFGAANVLLIQYLNNKE